MDEVIATALQQVALEGPEGCSIPTLWSILQEPLQAAGFTLDPPLRTYIWKQLLGTPAIHFLSPTPLERSNPSNTGEAPETTAPAFDNPPPPVIKQTAPTRYFLERGQPGLQTWEGAAALGGGVVRVQASKPLRETALGLYETVHSGYQLSAVQYESLIRIGQSRERGALQTDLARGFGIAPTNYFYHLRLLETRGLITRRQVLFPAPAGGFPIATNLVHLTRFGRSVNLDHRTHFRTGPSDATLGQKRLTYSGDETAPAAGQGGPSIVGGGPSERVGEASEPGAGASKPGLEAPKQLETQSAASEEAAGASGGGAEASGGGFEFIDLTRQLEDICGVLGAAQGGVLVESELRASMGYTNKREWRSLMRRLDSEGLVRQFQAEVNGRVKGCLQLRRGFHEAPEPRPEDEMEEEEGPEGVILDVPIDQQIYQCVSDAGREGILSNHLWKALHLNRKTNTHWAAALIESGRIIQRAETLKKAVLYRLWTAGNFPGGAEKQAQKAPGAEKGVGNPGEKKAKKVARETLGRDDAQTGGAAEERAEKEEPFGGLAEEERGEPGGAPAEGPGIEGAGDMQLVVYQGGESEGLGQGPLVSRFRRTSKMVTGEARTRRELILKKLETDRFILRSTLSRWLAVELGRDKPLDFKLVTRTLTDLQTEGLIKGVLVNVPIAGDPSRSRQVEVIISADFEPDQAFADFIGKRARGVERISRQTGLWTQKQRKGAVPVPVMANVERLGDYQALAKQKRETAERGLDMQNAMKHNGYLYSKALRARALHLYLWQHVFGSRQMGATDPEGRFGGTAAENVGGKAAKNVGGTAAENVGRMEAENVGGMEAENVRGTTAENIGRTAAANVGETGAEVLTAELPEQAEFAEEAEQPPSKEQPRNQTGASKGTRGLERTISRTSRPDVYDTMKSIQEILARASGGFIGAGVATPLHGKGVSAAGPADQPHEEPLSGLQPADADVSMTPLGEGGAQGVAKRAAAEQSQERTRVRFAESAAPDLDDASDSEKLRSAEALRPGSSVVDPGGVLGAVSEAPGDGELVREAVRKMVKDAKAQQGSALEKYLRFKGDRGGDPGAAAPGDASKGERVPGESALSFAGGGLPVQHLWLGRAPPRKEKAVSEAIERVKQGRHATPSSASENANKEDCWIDVVELVREMPVELYVKIVGSELSLERVNELTQSGAQVKDCAPDELRTEILGPQAMTRLANTVDMMRRMDLVTPRTRVLGEGAEGSPFPGPGNLGALYKLNESMYFEEPAEGGSVLHTFSVFDESDVLAYWDRLEACFSGLRKEEARTIFPGVVASEIVGRVWATRHELTPGQRVELGKRIPEEQELSAQEVEAIAQDTGIPTEQVYKVYYERTRRTRLKKLLSLGLSQTEVLTALRKKKALDGSQEKVEGPPDPVPAEPESAEAQRARARHTLTTERSHVRAFKRKQALASESEPPPLLGRAGIPGPLARDSPYFSWARENVGRADVSGAAPGDVSIETADGGTAGVAPERADGIGGFADVTDKRDDVSGFLAAGKHPLAKRPRLAPAAGERLESDGRLVVPPQVRKRRSRARAAAHSEGGESDGEQWGRFAGPPLRNGRLRKKPFAKRSKRFHWTGEDTKQLIAAYAQWHAIHGKRMPTEWDTVPGLPAAVSNCKRHMTKLRSDRATLEAIAYVVVLVAERRAAALAADPSLGGGPQLEEQTGPEPPVEEQPSESEQVVRELSLMLEDEKQRGRGLSKEAKQKGKGSTAEHLAMDRVASGIAPGGGAGFAWDDVTEPEYARALDEVVRCHEAAKAAQANAFEGVPPAAERAPSEAVAERGIPQPPRADVIAVAETERLEDRPGIASALGLIQIGLLHALPNGAISETVARALKRCGEADVAQAMQHLQAQRFVVQSKPTRPFRIADKFNQHLGNSPFPMGIGKSARDFHSALTAESSGKWIPLPSLPSEGQLAETLAMVVEGRAELEPFEPNSAPWGSERPGNHPPEEAPRERGAPEWEVGVRLKGPDGVDALAKGLDGGLDPGLRGAGDRGEVFAARASNTAARAYSDAAETENARGPQEGTLAGSSEQAGPRSRRSERRQGKAPESHERRGALETGKAPDPQQDDPLEPASNLGKAADVKGKRRLEGDETQKGLDKRPRAERPSTETGPSVAELPSANTETGPSARQEPTNPFSAVGDGPRPGEERSEAAALQADGEQPSLGAGPETANVGPEVGSGVADVSSRGRGPLSVRSPQPGAFDGAASGKEIEAAFELCCETWCSDDVALTSGGSKLDRDALRRVFEAARAAGEEGLTFDNVSEIVAEHLGNTRQGEGQQSGGNGHRGVEEDYVEALKSFDLVQRINSVNSVRIMTAPFSERHLLPVPSSAHDKSNQEPPRGVPGSTTELAVTRAEPCSGKGPLQGVGIRPWLTPRGGMNRAFCALLRRRIVSLVMANPGMPEELLVSQVEVLTPQSCRDFLESLVSEGRLSIRAIRLTAGPGDGVPRGTFERLTSGRIVKHYFASPAAIDLV